MTVRLKVADIDKMQEQIREAAAKAKQAAADAALATAQELSPVVTGSLAAGYYTASSEGSTYGEASSEAESLNPDVELLPEVQTPPPGTVVLSNCVEHSIYVEHGTVNQGPNPVLGTAALAAEQTFLDAETNLMRDALKPPGVQA